MKVRLQRKVEVWIEETYDIEEANPETFQHLIGDEAECYEVEPLWETQKNLGSVEIYDNNWDILYSNIKKDE